MDKIIELEMRIRILEKIVKDIVTSNTVVNYPDKSSLAQFKMEAFQELRKAYPDKKIEYPN